MTKPVPPIRQGDPRIIRGWVMYDWANPVYQLTIASAIFPVYYNQVTRSGETFLGIMLFFLTLHRISELSRNQPES